MTGTAAEEPLTVRVAAPTERRNPSSADLDLMSTLQVLHVINEADREVPGAVAAVNEPIAAAVEVQEVGNVPVSVERVRRQMKGAERRAMTVAA